MNNKETDNTFKGICNFRDIGGFILPNGFMMRQEQFFRSDELSGLSPKDWELLRNLRVKCILDLRAPSERTSKTYNIPYGMSMRLVHIPILSEEKDMSRWQLFCFMVREGRKLDFEEYMHKFYYRLAFERNKQIHQVIMRLSNVKNLPALIHCTGGKDRTGFIAAVLQLLAGVPREKVIESYLATNEVSAPRIEKIAKHIGWMSLWQISPERLQPMLEARREYLDKVFDEIFSRYDSIEEYLMKSCGVKESCLLRLRSLLVENKEA